MADEFTITAGSNNIVLAEATRQGRVTFTVANGLERPFTGQAQLELVGSGDESWLSLGGEAIRPFAVKGNEQFIVNIAVPAEAAVSDYIFRLNMVGVENPDEHFSEGPTVTFSVPQPVEPVKKPFPWWIVAVVAAILLIGGGAAYFLSNRAPKLSVSLSASTNSIVAGENLTYSINLANSGAGAASGFVLTDTLPANVSFVSASLAGCDYVEIDGLVVCPLPEIEAEGSTQLDITVQVDGAAREMLENGVFVVGETAENEISDLLTTDVVAAVTLTAALSGPATVEADNELVYEALVRNSGPSQATNVLIAYQPPAGAVETTIVGQDGECQPQDAALLCSLGSLNGGEEKPLTITLVPGPDSVGNLTTAITAVSNESEPVASPLVTTEVQAVTGLSVTIEPLNSAVVNETLTYAIQVWNNNPNREAQNVVLRYSLPEGATFQTARPDCLSNAAIVQCELGTLGSGIEAGIEIEVDLLPTKAGELLSSATVNSGNFPQVEEGQITAVERSFSSTGIVFDGGDSWVELQDFDVPESFTVEMWVHPDSSADKQAFIGKHTSDGKNIFLVGYWSGALHVNLRNKNYEAGVKPTELFHLAVVVEKKTLSQSQVTVYKDGDAFWTQEFASVLGDNISGKPWVLGQDWDENSLTDFYDGTMTEVRIWDHARSQAEVRETMNVRLEGQEAGLVGYWPLDGISGTQVADRSGNGLDGTLRGSAAWVQNLIIVIDTVRIPQIVEPLAPVIVSPSE
ncbi:MAG: LamG-like jellyroll fold domain-containing protein [Chloroflexota bacterium]